MRISVIIPCHNAAPYLAQTVGSVLEQDRQSDDIIIVEDRSTDETWDIAQQLACAEPRIRLLRSNAGNAAATRNVGAKEAPGDLLMFLDADDLLGAGSIATLSQAFQYQDVDISALPWRRLELIEGEWRGGPPTCLQRRAGEPFLSGWLRGWYYPPCALMWKRESFRRFGPWPEHLRVGVNDDGLLMMLALGRGASLRECSGAISYYRRLPDAGSLSSRRYDRDGLLDRADVLLEVEACLKERGDLTLFRRSLQGAFHRLAEDCGPHRDLAEAFALHGRRLANLQGAETGISAVHGRLRRLAGELSRRLPRSLAKASSASDETAWSTQHEPVTAGLAKGRELMSASNKFFLR